MPAPVNRQLSAPARWPAPPPACCGTAESRRHALLLGGLQRGPTQRLVAGGLEEGLGVGPVGLVAIAIARHVLGCSMVTFCPRRWSCRPQRCADPQASSSTPAGACAVKQVPNPDSDRRRVSLTCAGTAETATSKTDLARWPPICSVDRGSSPSWWPCWGRFAVLADWCRFGEEA